jgi:hypothetical protein
VHRGHPFEKKMGELLKSVYRRRRWRAMGNPKNPSLPKIVARRPEGAMDKIVSFRQISIYFKHFSAFDFAKIKVITL